MGAAWVCVHRCVCTVDPWASLPVYVCKDTCGHRRVFLCACACISLCVHMCICIPKHMQCCVHAPVLEYVQGYISVGSYVLTYVSLCVFLCGRLTSYVCTQSLCTCCESRAVCSWIRVHACQSEEGAQVCV